MTMFNPKDIETLHAYLDGVLSPQELAAFEALLHEDPNLREALKAERQFRTNFRTRLRQTNAPASLRVAVQQNEAPTSRGVWWQDFVTWWLAPKTIRPAVALLGLLLWSAVVIGLTRQASMPERDAVTIRDFIVKHELYFEGQPSLDMVGTYEEVNAWIMSQAPYAKQAPTLGSKWRVEGVRLDDLLHRRMIDILYFQNNGLDASLSIFDARQNVALNGEKVTYHDMVYYVTDDGWHRTIVWTSNEVGYALVGNLVISSDELFSMAATVRNQVD